MTVFFIYKADDALISGAIHVDCHVPDIHKHILEWYSSEVDSIYPRSYNKGHPDFVFPDVPCLFSFQMACIGSRLSDISQDRR